MPSQSDPFSVSSPRDFIHPAQSWSCSGLFGNTDDYSCVCVCFSPGPASGTFHPSCSPAHVCFCLQNGTSRTVPSKRQRRELFLATQLALPAGLGLGSLRFYSNKGLPGNSQKAGRPSTVPCTQEMSEPQMPGKLTNHQSLVLQASNPGPRQGTLWPLQHQSADQIPGLSTSTSLHLHLSPLDSRLIGWIILVPRPVGRPKE